MIPRDMIIQPTTLTIATSVNCPPLVTFESAISAPEYDKLLMLTNEYIK